MLIEYRPERRMQMRKPALTAVVVLMLSTAIVHAIATIKQVNLANGRDETNKIGSPVFDTAGVQPLHFTIRAAYDRSAKIVRKGATNMFTRGPEYNLDKAVDLGALLTDALRTEAAAMGFRTAGASEAGWTIEGEIKNVYMESKQIPYGLTLFYGYMDVETTVRRAGGGAETRRLRFHNYSGGYNAGMGRRDEAEEALAHLLVEGAQEAVARLNREFFKAPTHTAVDAIVGRLAGASPNDIHRVGLSNASAATDPLLKTLVTETVENRRSAIIDALARLGSPESVPTLTSRYATEEEDCRWYTLKAMDYIGGDAALALVKDAGVKDKDGGPRRLAQRIAEAAR
jgi:hypothetical protein